MNGNGTWKRYSLRAFLLGLTLVCVVLGMLAYARTPRPIHRRLEALGGQVETAGLPESANALRWCDALFGPLKRFHEIEIVEIQSDKFTDQELTRVCQLGTVGFLLANSAHVSDEGLRSLSDCNELDTLYLIAPVTDEGLQVIGSLRSLTGIEITSDEMEGKFLEAVEENAPIQSIGLRGKRVDDLIVDRLLRLKRIQRLNLSGTAISDAGLAKLATHRALRFIDVTDTQVTAEGRSEFERLAPQISLRAE